MGSMEVMVAIFIAFWVVVSTFIAAAVLKWLWNITLPELFGFKSVRYWQAFRLLVIAQLIFGPAFFKLTSPPSRSVFPMMSAMETVRECAVCSALENTVDNIS